MVKSKKTPDETATVPESTVIEAPIAEETAVPLMQTDQQIIQEQASVQQQLMDLILEAPKPEFFNINDAVTYQDKWEKWQQKVKATWNRLSL
jgi:hypothetical protein